WAYWIARRSCARPCMRATGPSTIVSSRRCACARPLCAFASTRCADASPDASNCATICPPPSASRMIPTASCAMSASAESFVSGSVARAIRCGWMRTEPALMSQTDPHRRAEVAHRRGRRAGDRSERRVGRGVQHLLVRLVHLVELLRQLRLEALELVDERVERRAEVEPGEERRDG